jgi:TolA-binding protein
MPMKRGRATVAGAALAAVAVWILVCGPVDAARQVKGERPVATDDSAAGSVDYAAMQMLQKGKDQLAAGEKERGIRILEALVQQYPNSLVRFMAYMTLGRHHIDNYEQAQAIPYLVRVKELELVKELPQEYKDILVESLYLTGVAHFQKREYSKAFPTLRKVTMDYPNTVWANQSYFYIGMCHFVQENWNKAIEALSLVGTYVDPDSPSVQYAEAGRRFYVKVHDADLPVMVKLGFNPRVFVETKAGDKEDVIMVPLSTDNPVFVGSLPTEVGSPSPNDNTLQVVGGDEITATYLDGNTQNGEKDKPRKGGVKVVATGGIFLSLGDYDTRTKMAYIDQPVYVVLQDADLDISPQADSVTLKAVSRYKVEDAEDAVTETGKGGFADLIVEKKKENFRVRDEVSFTLREIGKGEPVRTGRFHGAFLTASAETAAPDKNDDRLACRQDDEIVVTYVDELHGEGAAPRTVAAKAVVVGTLDSSVKITTPYVPDEMLRAKKNVVEAQAFLELGRIFKDMGLQQGANAKAIEGLDRANAVILTQAAIDPSLKEQAFKLKWELHIAQNDFASAVATCQAFNDLFPNSPFVDQALMGIAAVKQQEGNLEEAITVYTRILALQSSLAKAEAQYKIAECTEQMGNLEPRGAAATTTVDPGLERSIPIYKLVAEKYPDSPYAGPALGKLIDYAVENKDYTQASTMLEQVFQDYPDAPFLDAMLMKWVLVAYRMGDFKRAHEKCTQLLFEYPDSSYAPKAKEILPKIEAKL